MIKFADARVFNKLAIDTVVDVIRSGDFINGAYNDIFSQQWAAECNAESCILTSSGATALTSVLRGIRRPNHKNIIIIPALSYAATAFAVLEAGCDIAYVDVDERGLIRWDQVEELLQHYGNEVLAVMPVHLYGQLSNVPGHIRELIYVVEDACQAHGVVKFNKDESSIACFSFYPTKNLGTIGDAGAIVINNIRGLAIWLATYINVGDPPGCKYVHEITGSNLRCDNIKAAYLSITYPELEETNQQRAITANTYTIHGIPTYAVAAVNSHHLYPILVDNPTRFRSLMIDYNIEVGMHYPYMLPTIARGAMQYSCSQAMYISKHVVTLPVGINDGVHVVIDTIKKTCELHDDGLWYIKV